MRSFWIAAFGLAPSLALAQAEPPAILFGPASPNLHTSPPSYRSVFEPTISPGAETDWRRANDDAGRLRGHAGQIRAADAPPPSPPTPAPQPAPSSGKHDHDHP